MDKKEKNNLQQDKNAQKIELLEKRVEELENDWKRALADYKNLEKRTNEEKTIITQFANAVLIENLLPVLDNFTMLENHTDDEGVKMSIKEFAQTLKDAGLREVEIKEGDKFNPEIMDAVETIPGEENTVLEIIRIRYYFKEKLLRPVSVKVGRGKSGENRQ